MLLRQEFHEEFDHFHTHETSKINTTEAVPVETPDSKNEQSSTTDDIEVLKKAFFTEKRFVRDIQNKISTENEATSMAMQNLVDSVQAMSTSLGSQIESMARMFESQADIFVHALVELQQNKSCPATQIEHHTFRDCSDLLRAGHVTSGVYTVHPRTTWRPLQVYCDMETSGGGWTVMQRRKDGSENFNRPWLDYAFGFGDLQGEFWLGNEFVNRLVEGIPHKLRVELEDFEQERRLAEYGVFSVGPATDLYRLSIDSFSGNVTDSLQGHNGHQFSTQDKGPSKTCSASYKGGFWYTNCHSVNINGLYLRGEHTSYADGINWVGFKGYHYSLKFTEMKFRPW
ncbi:techylectin-5A-like [Mya arenaria]|uniref:techylectin-5A-like n=1 Tax=Mya arenaria TaxID=6604 RepID=UPI0022E0BEEE|nr:techylectin-5A-like [Mya arenaria]